ncbi:MAG: hypothetical protein ACRDRL_24520, partial [Sciscionella sp.]
EVRHRLAVLDAAAAGVRDRSVDVEAIRSEFQQMIETWRRLLAAHHPADGEQRCPRCRSWGRARRWPCPVWLSAHRSLITTELTAAPGRRDDPAGADPTPGAGGMPDAVASCLPTGAAASGRHARSGGAR